VFDSTKSGFITIDELSIFYVATCKGLSKLMKIPMLKNKELYDIAATQFVLYDVNSDKTLELQEYFFICPMKNRILNWLETCKEFSKFLLRYEPKCKVLESEKIFKDFYQINLKTFHSIPLKSIFNNTSIGIFRMLIKKKDPDDKKRRRYKVDLLEKQSLFQRDNKKWLEARLCIEKLTKLERSPKFSQRNLTQQNFSNFAQRTFQNLKSTKSIPHIDFSQIGHNKTPTKKMSQVLLMHSPKSLRMVQSPLARQNDVPLLLYKFGKNMRKMSHHSEVRIEPRNLFQKLKLNKKYENKLISPRVSKKKLQPLEEAFKIIFPKKGDLSLHQYMESIDEKNPKMKKVMDEYILSKNENPNLTGNLLFFVRIIKVTELFGLVVDKVYPEVPDHKRKIIKMNLVNMSAMN